MNFHSKKILILIIICNLAALVGYYFLFQYIKTQTEAASLLTSTIDLGQQTNSNLNSLRFIVKDTEDKRLQLLTFLLPGDAEVSFIGQIENLAKNSGLGVKINSVSSVAGDTDKTKTLQMQTETTGSWNNIMYFLNQIENLPFKINIQRSTINKPVVIGKPTDSAWTATIDISVIESI